MKHVPKWLRHPLWLVAVILFVWYISFGYKYGFIYSQGISMQPTIENGEWIIMQKRSAMGEGWTPDRYDVVIVNDAGSGESLSKRIIGLPGDTIEVREGIIYLNKRELKDPFGRGKILIYLVDENGNNLRYWDGPEEGEPVIELTSHKEEKIEKGCVWLIGDNRSESWYGILPIKDIKGLAVIF